MPDDGQELYERMMRVWGAQPAPRPFHDVEASYRARFAREFDALENFDWQSGRPEDLRVVNEPSTFVSKPTFLWLMPRVLGFLLKWGDEADVTFTSFYCWSPFVWRVEDFAAYSAEERGLMWEFLAFAGANSLADIPRREPYDSDWGRDHWERLERALFPRAG